MQLLKGRKKEMANWTDSLGRVKGSPENVKKFFKILNREDLSLPHLPRTSVNEYENEGETGWFDFGCAWSVVDCWFNYTCEGKEIGILELTETLNLEIKVLSSEIGSYYIEYFHVKNGNIIEENCWGEDDMKKVKLKERAPRGEKHLYQLWELQDQLIDKYMHL
jgi:hypothetical protein